MRLKEQTNNPPFCNLFSFFQIGPFILYIPICGLFLGMTWHRPHCRYWWDTDFVRNHKFRLPLFHPTPSPEVYIRFTLKCSASVVKVCLSSVVICMLAVWLKMMNYVWVFWVDCQLSRQSNNEMKIIIVVSSSNEIDAFSNWNLFDFQLDDIIIHV